MRSIVLDFIFSAIDEVNPQLPPESRLGKSEMTIIMGKGGVLDSLGFLNLVVSAEGRVDAGLHTSLNLASMLMESDHALPRTVGELADLIVLRLEGAVHG